MRPVHEHDTFAEPCRCRSGAACVEVVARLAAADRSAGEGFPSAAAELRATARRHADRHRQAEDQLAGFR